MSVFLGIKLCVLQKIPYFCTHQNKKTMATTKKLIPGRDALQRYLDEIGDAPLMTDAEEQALAVRIAAGDKQAANQLATANLRYVVTIARQYLPTLTPTHEGCRQVRRLPRQALRHLCRPLHPSMHRGGHRTCRQTEPYPIHRRIATHWQQQQLHPAERAGRQGRATG